jgi:hypothetical protein
MDMDAVTINMATKTKITIEADVLPDLGALIEWLMHR